MNWVKRCKIPTTKAIKFNRSPYNSLYNSVFNYTINIHILDKIPQYPSIKWPPFSVKEFRDAIAKYNNISVPGLDHLLWCYLKEVLIDNICVTNIIKITNVCIYLSHWPTYFKKSMLIVIPKAKKVLYDSSKSFYSIVLLNILDKLIEKVTSKCIQFYILISAFLHSNQLGGIQQHSTSDAGIFLSYIVWTGW